MGTDWLPHALLIKNPNSFGTPGQMDQISTTNAGLNRPEALPAGAVETANRLIVDDLIHSVETDTRPLANVESARLSIDMMLAAYRSQPSRSGVPLPMNDRTHPLARASHP